MTPTGEFDDLDRPVATAAFIAEFVVQLDPSIGKFAGASGSWIMGACRGRRAVDITRFSYRWVVEIIFAKKKDEEV